MKKRILSFALNMLLIVTIFPISVFAAKETMQTSETGLAMIKQFEGFAAIPMADGTQWSVGYGNACDPNDYPDGISETEADELLREAIAYFEESINRFLNAYGVLLSQTQFDALVSITYNLGVSWINSSYRFWTMLRNGLGNYTDNQIASAIGVWCHVGSQVNTSVLQRRIAEIRLFLYGDYTGTDSPNFSYVIFNGNGGGISTDVMLYRQGEKYLEFPEATRSGYYFAGWYTAAEGGTQVLKSQAAARNQTVYAQWSKTPTAVILPSKTGDYSDVNADAWYFDYVMDLSDAGVVNGYQDGTYRPQAVVTAGQALKLILIATGWGEQKPISSHWSSGYHTLALQNHFLDDGEIADLDAPISRALIAKVAANAMGLDPGSVGSPFADTDDGYVAAMYHAGILEGSIDSVTGNRLFYPQNDVKRSEIAKIIWMIYNI